MLRGIGISASQLAVGAQRLKILGANLSNVDTPGYVQDLAAQQSFDELYLNRLDAGSAPVGALDLASVPTRPGVDLATGPIEQTDRPLDLAITGPGFFSVQSPDGVLYTRRGTFRQDLQGRLVSLEGWPVLGQRGPITATGPLAVSPNGTVSSNGQAVDQLRVVTFGAGVALDHRAGTYVAPSDGAPTIAANPDVMSGALEGSNVDVTATMTDILAATRSYQLAQRAIVTQDTALQKLIETTNGR